MFIILFLGKRQAKAGLEPTLLAQNTFTKILLLSAIFTIRKHTIASKVGHLKFEVTSVFHSISHTFA